MSMFVSSVLPKSVRPKPKKPKKSARHRLRKLLIGMITKGRFRPGAKLLQTHLAKRFGVSVSVMREALLDVQAHGLVENHDNHGFYVRQLDVDALLDLFDLREVLEGLAARKACSRITPEQVVELGRIIEEMCAAEKRGEFERRGKWDRQFHDVINEISGSHAVLSLTRQFSQLGKVTYGPSSLQHIRVTHEPLLKAIADNKPDLAERLSREHVRNGRAEMEENLRNGKNVSWLALP